MSVLYPITGLHNLLMPIRAEIMGVTEGHEDAETAIEWFLGNMDRLSP